EKRLANAGLAFERDKAPITLRCPGERQEQLRKLSTPADERRLRVLWKPQQPLTPSFAPRRWTMACASPQGERGCGPQSNGWDPRAIGAPAGFLHLFPQLI